ncbi:MULTISPECIES: DUF885 family protein [Euryhalocaulis]|uniref:DUF885 family protein n=1 Tax=Euryhalocaulis TaxID=1712422 RepID=UPI0003A71116|nr:MULTISPECIES: DUF885 family protein [Euryhalocaulis]MBA4800849.1 DUF885 family protein [Euryhalocaulis sp.]
MPISFGKTLCVAAAVAFAPLAVAAQPSMDQAELAGPPSGAGSYQDLVSLYDEFLEWKDDAPIVGEIADSEPWSGVADYSDEAVAERREQLDSLMARMMDMNVAAWDQPQQADYLAVRAKLDEHNFLLNVSKPWERDPGFYVDQMLTVPFAELPLEGEALEKLHRDLRAVPVLVREAKNNLDNVAADYADLALHNLTNADGVGHGHPYRETPPAGVIGWYEDLESRLDQQPELRDDVEAAKAAVEDFHSWLTENRPQMTADAGVGQENFDWYLKQVKLLPYDSRDIVTLGNRELDRLWAMYALERHRNRDLPELAPASSAEEYEQKIQQTDKDIREFLVEEEVITIPEYAAVLGTNVPWIVRPQGRNFWEEIQYRDPSPDHLHAVIPGHRFDGVVEDHNDDPIRGRLTDGVRTEGWGVYLEEGMQHLGLFEDKPRVRELIYAFGIFRAARMPADVWLQHNKMTVNEVVDLWREQTPYLDANVARVDAEIYLRRPPGYGLGYMTGMVQMQKLLADRKRQLGEDFNLKEFHDTFMDTGRLPMVLVRWEMTGLEDEVQQFWAREPLPQ